MKNAINIANNVNLILNTYKYLFFKHLLGIFDVVTASSMQDESAIQRGKGKIQLWNLYRSKHLNP